MIHVGDITKLDGAFLEPVDCIVGGSPCQDLSVAGKRAGLAGERSGLFMEQIRVTKEMRKADEECGRTGDMVRPRYLIWENVPGAFSSNNGEDFKAVLEEIVRVAEPQAPDVPLPPKGKWPTAGLLMGDGWSVAWRTHDAQYWGVAQRRRRISVVADFGGQAAPEVLFERKGVSGYPKPGRTPWQGPAGNLEAGADAAGGSYTLQIRCRCDGGGKGPLVQNDKSATLSTSQTQTLFALEGNGQRASHQGDGYREGDVSYTLNTVEQHGVAYAIDQQGGKGMAGYGVDVCPTIASDSHGTPHGVAYNIGAYESNAWKSDNPHSGVYKADTTKTLDAINCGYPGCNQGGTAIVEPIVYNGENITSPLNKANPQPGDPCHTLDRDSRNYVAFAQNVREEVRDLHGVAGALSAESGTHQTTYVAEAIGVDAYNQTVTGDVPMSMTAIRSDPNHVPCVLDMTHANDVIRDCGDVVPTLQSRMGTGGNQVPLVMNDE